MFTRVYVVALLVSRMLRVCVWLFRCMLVLVDRAYVPCGSFRVGYFM